MGIACWWTIAAPAATGAGCGVGRGALVVTVRYGVVHTAARNTSRLCCIFRSSHRCGPIRLQCRHQVSLHPGLHRLLAHGLELLLQAQGNLEHSQFRKLGLQVGYFLLHWVHLAHVVAGLEVALVVVLAPRSTSPIVGPPCTALPSHTLPAPATLRGRAYLVPPSAPSRAPPPP